MIEKMEKVRIIGPKKRLSAVVEELHKLRIIHIVEEEFKDFEGLERGEPLPDAEKMSEALVRARAAEAQLRAVKKEDEKLNPRSQKERKKKIGKSGRNPKIPLNRLIREVTALTKDLQYHLERKKEAEQLLEKSAMIKEQEELLSRMGLSADDFRECETLESFFGTIKKKGLRKSLEPLKDEFLLKELEEPPKSKTKSKGLTVALFVVKKHAESAKEILASHDYAPIELLQEKVDERTAQRQFKEAENAIKKLAREKEEIKEWISILEEAVEKAEAPLKFCSTEETFLIHGFIPKNRFNSVLKKLMTKTKGKLHVEPAPFKKGEPIPVELENPDPVKNFHFFLDLYSLPSYKEIDPSWFLFLTFPIFFGFMLGDLGYGLTSLIIFLIMRNKMKKMSGAEAFFNILILSSAITMVFGLVFGEFFGYEMYEPLISRDPAHSLTPLMITAIALGILHVNWGLITGFVNEHREHGFLHAFLEKGSWIVLQLAVALLALIYTRTLTIPAWIGYGALALSIIMLYLGEGVKGLVEMPGIFGNILSYLRLMAIGLASVGLALVINDMASGFFHKGPLMIIAGAAIMVVGHIINIGIGLLGSFLHSLRLHYVEFFGKFYKGGGIRFKPFGAK